MQEATVLLADDGSEPASTAWKWVCAQNWAGWRAICLHVEEIEVPTMATSAEAELPRPWDPPGELERRAPLEANISSIEYLRASGDPRVVLYRIDPPDLLVLGAGTASRRLAPLLGSTARYVLENPPAPTVIAKNPVAGRRVALLCDASVHSAAAVEAFAGLPWAEGAAIDVVFVQQRKVSESSVRESVEAILQAALPGTRFDFVSLQGRPKASLVSYIAESRPPYDLVVAGTRGHSTLPRPHLGSVTHALVHRTDANLLVAHFR